MNPMAIEVEGLCKSYRFFDLQNIALRLARGTIMGLIGPNGAGKSTTIRILMGLVHQDRGEVQVLGHRMPDEQIAAKWDIGFASEDMRLYGAMTLGWHMDSMQSLYESWDSGYAQLLLKRFGLRAEQKIKGLSHGQRVKAALLLVFARRPKLLVLDEPTTGLDPVARHEILRELRRSHGRRRPQRLVLFAEHAGRGANFRLHNVHRPGPDHRFNGQRGISKSMAPLATGSPGRSCIACVSGNYRYQADGPAGGGDRQRIRARSSQCVEGSGARVHAVENMTLEEIFVANVEHSREEVEA